MSYKECTLAEISESVNYGYTASANHEIDGPKFLRITDIRNDFIDWPAVPSCEISESDFKKYSLETGDIVVARTGATTGLNAIITDDNSAVFASYLVRFKINKEVANPFYVHLAMSTKEWMSHINSVIGGSAQPGANAKQLGRYKIKLPSIDTQDRIVELFYPLIKSQSNNLAIIEKLEKLASLLFERWFIDFEFPNEEGQPYKSSGGEMVESELGMIPKGWDVENLDSITSKFATGLNPRKNFVLGEGENYYVTIKNMGQNRIYLNGKCDKVTDEALIKINRRSNLQKGDVLFSGIGTIGRVYLIDEEPHNWNISESIFTLRANEQATSEYLYLLLLSTEFQNYAIQLASGSVQKGIRMGDLKKYKIPLPPKEIMKNFTEIIENQTNIIKNLEKESDKLTVLRDTLLPQLLSGEIEVPVEIESALS